MNFFDDDEEEEVVEVKEEEKSPEGDEPVVLSEIPPVVIQNIVYLCQMQNEFRLELLVRAFRKWLPQLNLKKFPALCIRFRTRLKESKIAFLIFKNGKIICTGIKTEYHALYLMQQLLLPEFRSLGYSDKILSFSVFNLVAHAQLPFGLDLKAFSKKHTKCHYEPEVFPSAHFTSWAIKPVSMSLFSTGLVIISGAKKLEEAVEKFRLMYPEFCRFQMEKEAPKTRYTEKQKVMDQIFVDLTSSMPKKMPRFLSGPENKNRDNFFGIKNNASEQGAFPRIKQEESMSPREGVVKKEPLENTIKVKQEDIEDEIGFGEQFGISKYSSWA